ncbi:MAG: RNA polymerase sigma-70 factor [Clostridium sp.]|nr:RNA polymerase sigma-70 factor [Clostridium sp.]
MSFENILYKISKGNERAFNQFMDEWTQRLYYYAYGIVGSKESAEEVVSDVFFEAWKHRKELLEIESIGQWLRTVTYRKAVSMLRHESTEPTRVSLDDVEMFTIAPVGAPDETIISKEEQDNLNKAIESLPEKCKHVFYLAKIDKVPYKQITEMLGITLPTVNYHVAYAMDKLKKALKPGGGEKALVLLLAMNFFLF